ncbi:unnamed protein product [Heligmosomoides polygyrus]|uniref:CBFD_NFYB_HMF domain-containing protein n=1 Tax=Heligmosomoides polygyrus TaxID=6339 RepID=A0A3P8G318_HELPZ|nr:unnamed protein product [Heligmosomoides polygyrus]
MQSDEEIGRMVASVPVAIGRAMEHFAEKFLQAAAQATQLSNSRTLTPVHMKQAMMANQHFHFLADIFKEVAVPGRMGTEFDPTLARQQMQVLQAGLPPVSPGPSPVCSPCAPISPMGVNAPAALGVPSSTNGTPFTTVPLPSSVPYNLPYSPLLPNIAVPGQAQPIPTVQYPVTATSSPVVSQVSITRKAVNGKKTDTAPDGEKSKRGRPRKVKRSEKCLDEELCEEVTNGGSGQGTDAAAGSSVGSSETSCVTLGVAVASSIILFVYESHSDRREAGTTPHVDLMVQCSIAIRSLRQTLILAVVPTHTSFS